MAALATSRAGSSLPSGVRLGALGDLLAEVFVGDRGGDHLAELRQ